MDFDEELWRKARTQGDPLADECIAAVFRNGQVERLNDLFLRVHRNPGPPVGFSPEVDAYLLESSRFPSWYDPGLVERGEAVFFQFGFVSVLVLWAASLPECYRIPEEARVLHVAGGLIEDPEQRIRKTARFVFPVMMEGGIRPGGPGVPYVQKVRLIHAAIRHLLLQPSPGHAEEATGTCNSMSQQTDTKNTRSTCETQALCRSSPRPRWGEADGEPFHANASGCKGRTKVASRLLAHPWQEREHGVPINHWQLAYTLLTFSHVVLEGYEKIGITLEPEAKLGYIHVWKVVGHLLGIPHELMPDTPQEQAELFARLRRSAKVTEEGRRLTATTLQALRDRWPPLVRPALRSLGPVLARRILGDGAATELGIPTPRSELSVRVVELALRLAVGFDRFTDRFTQWNSFQEGLLGLSRSLTAQILQEAIESDDYALQVPDELLNAWAIELPPGPRRSIHARS